VAGVIGICLVGSVRAGAQCPGGVFEVRGRPLVPGSSRVPDAVVLGADTHVAIGSGCESVAAARRVGRRSDRIDAAWPACGPATAVRLRARVGGRTCRRLRGVLVTASGRRRFRAVRRVCRDGEPVFGCARGLTIAHRGGADLRPENTLAAFDHAAALGANVLEMDVQGTSDGAIVVLHDTTVDRTTDGTGPVKDLTLAQVQGLDAGYDFSPDGGATHPFRGQGVRIPTLHEVLVRHPDRLLSIEIKQYPPAGPSIVEPVVSLLAATGALSRSILVSFDHATMEDVRAIAPPALRTGMSLTEMGAFFTLDAAQEATYVAPAPVLQAPLAAVTPALMARAERAGLIVQVWTVDARPDMDRLLALGVHGIMSDLPDLLGAAVAESDFASGR
jgi:glycerophosphoryl diester phosphodiesterase